MCVTPAIRTQAKADNAAAAQRRNSLNISTSRYARYGTWRFQVNVTNINNGRALVVLYRSNGTKIKSWSANVTGNRLALRTERPDCERAADTYFAVKDPSSGRWSQRAVRQRELRPDLGAGVGSRQRCASARSAAV